jgi:hypothetical protein
MFYFSYPTNDYLQMDYVYAMGTGTTTTPGTRKVQQLPTTETTASTKTGPRRQQQ